MASDTRCYWRFFLGAPLAALLEFAGQAYARGDYSTAYKNWTAALPDVDPSQQYLIHTNRGVALEKLGHISKAIDAYDEALQSKEDHVDAWHNRGVALKALNKLDEAQASFEGALYYQPKFFPSLRGRYNILIEMSKWVGVWVWAE